MTGEHSLNSTEFPVLSHQEAVLEVYKYTPQIKDYDRFMHCGARWLPYTMYFHEKNFVSDAVNTDALGSQLAEVTGEVWLNFAGRGYNATQELIMFLMHQDKFTKINRVVVLSGINTLALEGIPEEFSSDHGRYYYSFEFQHYMNKFNEDMKRKKDSFDTSGSGVLKRLKLGSGEQWNSEPT